MITKSQFINLNNFEKLETIESGDFGVILRIEEKSTGRTYAAKIPDKSYAEKTNVSREIEILQIEHPSISNLIGFCPFDFDNNRRPVIITEFYPNRSLKRVLELKKGNPSLSAWTNTKKLINIYGIASAMSFLHSHQIIHRELNTSNVLEDDYLYPQITQFSFSRNDDDSHFLSHNIFDKTPIYLAPELFESKTFSYATDVYSFSLIVYQILTNEIPFEKLKPMDILIKVAKQGFRPDISRKSIPVFFQKLITDCWSQDPEKRPTFEQIVELLKDEKNYSKDFDFDEKEFSIYVNFIEECIRNPGMNKSFNFSEHGIEKVRVFKKVEKEPLSYNIELTDLSNFKQFGRIGEGTFGIVYEVINFETGKKYACKVFKNKFYNNFENDAKLTNLKNELVVLMNMHHPAILKFIGFNSISFDNLPNPVIFTELAENRSLAAILQLEKNGLASEFWTDTKKLINIYGIASGMAHLHSQNIIHRNLKPSNILIDGLIHPKLADFGFSRILSANADDKDELKRLLVGTYAYIAPEIFEKKEYSKASDVYAFSMIVYEILTNKKPISGTAFYQIVNNVTKGFRPEITDDIPESYKKLLQDCWSPDPRDRPTFEDILKQLRNDKSFISSKVNQNEYYDYVHKIDKLQSNFEHKVIQIIDYETIYQKQKVFLITDGILNLKCFTKMDQILKDNYSNTYRVIDKNKKIIYSAKESNIEMNNLCKEDIETLRKDCSVLSSMDHPYILKFIGYSSHNFDNIRKPVIIMEYVSDKTLEDMIDMERNGIIIEGWNDTKKLIIIFGIAYCMSFLHSHDIIHRNLRPSNIIIDDNYHPKISGFGLYKQNLIRRCLEMQSIFNPKENFVYAIPEIMKTGKYCKESDVYSFGYIVYELITNEKPFLDIRNKIELLDKIANENLRPPLKSSIPACYKELIESCWSPNPQERPSFDKIVSILKKDSRFITDNIDKSEYNEFVKYKYVEPENYNLQQLMNQADNNDAKALFRFGLLYSKGIAMPLNMTKAARFYQKSASLGYAPAQCNLGKMYLRGYGIRQDKSKALELFESAASHGDAKALFNLGVMYYKGNGVEQNYERAIFYYEQAVAKKDSDAEFNLGVMYELGEGVPVDIKRAFELFKESAKYGNAKAQFKVGSMYEHGFCDIVSKDIHKSIQMYQKASDQNYSPAMLNLGNLYLEGFEGVASDKEKAIQLFERASKLGNEEAKVQLEILKTNENKVNEIEIENINKKVEEEIEKLHNSLFTSFFNDFESTLTYINEIFIEKVLSELFSKTIDIREELKKINTETSTMISTKNHFPSLNQGISVRVDPMNEEINEINKLKFEIQDLETKLNRIDTQIVLTQSNTQDQLKT